NQRCLWGVTHLPDPKVEEFTPLAHVPMRRRDHEDALGSATAGGVGWPAWGGPIGECRELLRRRQLQQLCTAVLRRSMLLQLVPATVPNLLQAGPRHGPGKTVANLLPD